MSFKYIKSVFLLILFSAVFTLSVVAEDAANTVNSVKVKSVGDNSVVVDVYIDSTDKNIKPQLSSRKYKDDKYIIDLINVQDNGNVKKDTTASSGLVKNKDVRVGNVSGGSVARVLINLDDPKLEVKEVRYHLVDKVTTASDNSELKPKEEKLTISKPETNVEAKIAVEPKLALKPKVDIKPVSEPVKKAEVKPVAKPVEKVEVKPIIEGPQVIHKTDKKVELASKPVSIPVIHKKPEKQEVKHTPKLEVKEKPVEMHDKKTSIAKILDVNKEASKNEVKHVKEEKPHVVIEKKADLDKELKKTVKQKQDETLLVQAHSEDKTSVVHKEKSATATSSDEGHNENVQPEVPIDIEQTPIKLGSDVTGEDVRTIEPDDGNLNMSNMLSTLGLALLVIIPLIVVTIWIMGFVYKGGEPVSLKSLTGVGGAKFKIVSSTSLGQGKSIHLVEIKGRQLVIGCTNNSINILTEFGDFDAFVEENAEEISEKQVPGLSASNQYKRSRPPIGSFADLYKDYRQRVDEKDLEDEY